jgi:hypothetical protein
MKTFDITCNELTELWLTLEEAVRRIREIIPEPDKEPDECETRYCYPEEEELEQALALLPADLTLGARLPGVWAFQSVKWHTDHSAEPGEENVLVMLRGSGWLEVLEPDGVISGYPLSDFAPLAVFDDTLRHRFVADAGTLCQALIFHRPRRK